MPRPICLNCGCDFEPYPNDYPPEDRGQFCGSDCEHAYREAARDLTECECDNTHEQDDTVCRWCWAQGRRHWNDPEV